MSYSRLNENNMIPSFFLALALLMMYAGADGFGLALLLVSLAALTSSSSVLLALSMYLIIYMDEWSLGLICLLMSMIFLLFKGEFLAVRRRA